MGDNSCIPQVVAVRRFSSADQTEFADLSGDANPIHMDPVAARRLMAGRCIVHGMHALLWALDEMAKIGVLATQLKVTFSQPIFLDEDIACIWNADTGQVALQVEGVTLSTISLVRGVVKAEDLRQFVVEQRRIRPVELTFSECVSVLRKPLYIYGDPTSALRLFPVACRFYGLAVVCEIAALSEVVGMECPGLHSLFASLRINIEKTNCVAPTFGVVESDDRFKFLRIALEGRTIRGEIEAIHRPSPSQNLHISELAKYVQKDEFKNSRALIVGGSRGLGELVAKLIAAGGGYPTVTYNSGRIEADKLVDEILGYGGRCSAFQLTVANSTVLPRDLDRFNQFYYFATPSIAGKRSKKFDAALYQDFLNIYVDGFRAICHQISSRGQDCSVFYPSTIYIEQPPPKFAHYVNAKVIGEELCRELKGLNNHLTIHVPRLPRLATDQTQSLTGATSGNLVEVMLPFVRQMQ